MSTFSLLYRTLVVLLEICKLNMTWPAVSFPGLIALNNYSSIKNSSTCAVFFNSVSDKETLILVDSAKQIMFNQSGARSPTGETKKLTASLTKL